MLGRLQQLKDETLARIAATGSSRELEQVENAVLGRKGEITLIKRSIGQLEPAQRPLVGQQANQISQELEAAFAARRAELEARELADQMAAGALDVTLPGRRQPVGRLHPSTQMLRRIYDIWREMGFQVYLSRDVEDDDTNFTLLNIPEHHPARDMWDTFYTTERGVILRTHTSPGQIRAMREYAPEPIRVILPGMVYRYEQVDATHEMQFYQVEGLAVGRGIRMTDLKGTMIALAQRLYGEKRPVRFRCSHFPFTEPSVEVDVEWEGGWLEIGGAGMVHPVVLKNGGYDPRLYSGFAFGLGPDRMTMIRHGIQDIRYFWANDLRFLEQF